MKRVFKTQTYLNAILEAFVKAIRSLSADDRRREIQQQRSDGLCETASWQLLVGGRMPVASHHSCTTSSEEPPLSNFNSQWDLPPMHSAGL